MRRRAGLLDVAQLRQMRRLPIHDCPRQPIEQVDGAGHAAIADGMLHEEPAGAGVEPIDEPGHGTVHAGADERAHRIRHVGRPRPGGPVRELPCAQLADAAGTDGALPRTIRRDGSDVDERAERAFERIRFGIRRGPLDGRGPLQLDAHPSHPQPCRYSLTARTTSSASSRVSMMPISSSRFVAQSPRWT